jgi:PAS domain-containing protein
LPLRNAEGEVVAQLAVTREITARKQAEEALRQSEERHRTIIEEMTDSYWETISPGTSLSSMTRCSKRIAARKKNC